MKKIITALLLILALLAGSVTALGEEIIINKISNPGNTFDFEEGTPLLEVYFPAVYGVDAAYVRYGEYSMLIDCAGNQWRTFNSMLEKLGVTEVTYALNSHPDADHIGGFNHVLKTIACGEFLLGFPEDFPEGDDVRFRVYEDLHAMGIPFRRVSSGETIEFGDVQMTVLQRFDEDLIRVNARSVMLMIQLGERRIFFTGDIQAPTQRLLAADDSLDLHADILKYPHHGYGNMQENFLKKVAPELVIITSGSDDADGKDILRRYGIPFHYTASGTLRLATDGNVWTVERVK